MKNFKRVKENFGCEVCGAKVVGDGYTDHCPKCLWGKHVDKEIPGDRASECKGLLEPVQAVYQAGSFKIHYKCQKCGYIFRVREGENDNREALMELTRNPSPPSADLPLKKGD